MSDPQNLFDIFSGMQDNDELSADAGQLLVNNLSMTTTLGAQGTSVDDLAGDEVVILVRVQDQSSSMLPYQQDVIDGRNFQVDALKGSAKRDHILLSTWMFNDRSSVLHGFVNLDDVPLLDTSNYKPEGTTAMYDAFIDAITSTVAYVQTLLDSGIRVSVVISLTTDGEDNSSRHTAADVRAVIESLKRQEIYTFVLVAFGAGYAQSAAQAMGIDNVLETNLSAQDIRAAYHLESESFIRHSQTVIGGKTAQSSNFFN